MSDPDTDGDGILDGEEFSYAGPIDNDSNTSTTSTEIPTDTTSNGTENSDPNFLQDLISDPGAIGTYSVGVLLIVLIGVTIGKSKKTL